MATPAVQYKSARQYVSRCAAAFRFAQGASSSAPWLSWAEVLDLWVSRDAAFHQAFTHELATCPFEDFFWECCPVSAKTADAPFEFAMVSANGRLDRTMASAAHFQEHFSTTRAHQQQNFVASFPNLGGDAVLVAPKPLPVHGASNNLCDLSLLSCCGPHAALRTGSFYAMTT